MRYEPGDLIERSAETEGWSDDQLSFWRTAETMWEEDFGVRLVRLRGSFLYAEGTQYPFDATTTKVDGTVREALDLLGRRMRDADWRRRSLV